MKTKYLKQLIGSRLFKSAVSRQWRKELDQASSYMLIFNFFPLFSLFHYFPEVTVNN